MATLIEHYPDEHRFTALSEAEPAGYIEYERRGPNTAILHTVVEPAFEGQGVGSSLAREALATARSEGWGVLPYCTFIQSYIGRHSEYLDLVPDDQRAAFNLTTSA